MDVITAQGIFLFDVVIDIYSNLILLTLTHLYLEYLLAAYQIYVVTKQQIKGIVNKNSQYVNLDANGIPAPNKVSDMAGERLKVAAGSLILSEKPFVYALSLKYRLEYCDYCFMRNELRKCSNCHYVAYCNRGCQQEGWTLHKFECGYLKKISPREIPNAARLLIRLIKKLEKGGNMTKSHYTSTKFRMFKDLMSHYPKIKEDPKKVEHLQSLCGVLKTCLGDNFSLNPVELMGIYGRMSINSFNICDDELNSIGTGIYLAASILDHSCQPNAVAIFQGTLLNIRTTQDFPSLDWNKIRISYIDTLQLTPIRQNELLTTYYFLCDCDKCMNEEEDKVMTAAACLNTKCDGTVFIKDVADKKQLKCEKCQTIIPTNFIEQFEEITELSDFHLRNMKLASDFDVCQVCLKKQEGILHKLNIQRVRILDAALDSSIDFKHWDTAKRIGLELIDGYVKYLGEYHPLTGLLYLKLAKIMMYQEYKSEAKTFLEKACKVLKITHGTDGNIFKREIIPLIHSY